MTRFRSYAIRAALLALLPTILVLTPGTAAEASQGLLPQALTRVAIAAGHQHGLCIKSDGSLWAWGYNDYGQLGLGDTKTRTKPVQVGSATSWKAVACGLDYTLALWTNGSLWAWGYNDYGQLGLGDTKTRTKPGAGGQRHELEGRGLRP